RRQRTPARQLLHILLRRRVLLLAVAEIPEHRLADGAPWIGPEVDHDERCDASAQCYRDLGGHRGTDRVADEDVWTGAQGLDRGRQVSTMEIERVLGTPWRTPMATQIDGKGREARRQVVDEVGPHVGAFTDTMHEYARLPSPALLVYVQQRSRFGAIEVVASI